MSNRRTTTTTTVPRRQRLAAKILQGGLALGMAAVPMTLVASTGTASAAVVPSSPPANQVTTFEYTGGPQLYTVPANVYGIEINASGAAGGAGVGFLQGDTTPDHVQGGAGGVGGVVHGGLAVTPGEKLYIDVGGRGGDGVSTGSGGTVGAAGSGGGAPDQGAVGGNQSDFVQLNNSGVGGGGGGGTEITTTAGHLLVVAGGGGGGGGAWSATNTVGGPGGAGGNPSGNGGFGLDKSTTPPTANGTGGVGGGNSAMAGTAGADATVNPFFQISNDEGGGGGGGGGYLGGTGGSADAGGGGGGSYADPTITQVAYSSAPTAADGQVTITTVWANNLLSSPSTTFSPGQAVTLTDRIIPSDPSMAVPTGTVTFTEINLATQVQTPIATVPVSPWLANETTATIQVQLPSGTDGVIATYNGGVLYPASSSQVVTETSTLLLPQDSLTASAANAVSGAPVTFSATIAPPAAGGPTPTGSVTFNLGASGSLTPLATVPLDSTGRAAFTTSGLPIGTDRVFGTYSGDASYAIGSPGYVDETVAMGFVNHALSTNSTVATAATAITVTDTLSSSSGPGATPTGLVTFSDYSPTAGLTTLGTAPAVGGTATLTVHLPVGTNQLSASYSGDSNYYASSSFYVTETNDASLYVADDQNNAIRLLGPGSTGNQALGSIAGPATQLSNPDGVVLASNGTLYVANSSANTITEYAAGATGNAAPVATISGQATQLSGPRFITLDHAGRLYVVDSVTNSVTVYAKGATGNAAPVATIAGSATGINNPVGMAVDSAGVIWVSNLGNNSLTGYAHNANGNVAPTYTVAGASTGLNAPKGISFDSKGELLVANASSVNWYRATPNGNQAPVRMLSGAATGLVATEQALVDPSNGTVVADSLTQGILSSWPMMSSGNVAPIVVASGYNFPTQMALFPSS